MLNSQYNLTRETVRYDAVMYKLYLAYNIDSGYGARPMFAILRLVYARVPAI